MAEIASAYISLIPSLRGAQREIERQMGPIGQRTGQQFGQDFNDGASGAIEGSGGIGGVVGGAGGFGTEFGKKFGAAAAIGIAAAVGASIKSAADQEVDSDRLAAALGATPAEQKRLGKLAGSIFAEAYGESFTDVTSAIENVRGSFRELGTGADLERVTKQALDFASIFQIDLPRATQVAQTAVRDGFAKNATDALDLFTKGLQQVAPNLREPVLDAVEEYGQFFKTVGFDGPQAMELLVNAADKGTFGVDKIGDAIKEFSIRSTDMSTGTVDAFKLIDLNAQNIANGVLKGGEAGREATKQVLEGLLSLKPGAKQANAAIALFGTPLEDLNVRDIPEFLRSLKSTGKGLKGFKGAIEDAGSVLNDNASTNLEQFKRSITQTFVNVIGGRVIPRLRDFIRELNERATPVLEGVRKVARKLDPVFRAIGGFLEDNSEYVKAFAVGLAAVVGAITAVTVATTLFSIALNSTGIPLVVIAIAALVAGLIIAYRRSEQFRNIVDQIGAGLRQFAGFVRAEVIPVVVSTAQAVAARLKPILTQLGETFRKDILPTIQKAVAKFREWQPTIQRVVAVVVRLYGQYLRFQAAVAGKVIPVIIKFAGFVFSKVVPAIVDFIDRVVQVTDKVIAFGEKVSNATKDVVDFAKKVKAKIDDVVDEITGLPGRAKSALGDLSTLLVDAGKQIAQGLIDGIKSKANDVIDAAKGLADGVKKLWPGSPVKEGPLRSWNDGKGGVSAAGRRLADGLAVGIARGTGGVQKSMKGIADAVANSTEKTRREASRSLERLVDAARRAVDRLKSRLGQVQGQFDSLASSVSEAFRPDLFAGSLGDFFSTGTTGVASMKAVLAAFKKLRTMRGVSKNFLSDLLASGNTNLVLQLAGSDAGTVRNASRIYGQTNQLSDRLGQTVARNQYGGQLKDIRGELKEANRHLDKLADRLGDKINGAARDGRKKGKRK